MTSRIAKPAHATVDDDDVKTLCGVSRWTPSRPVLVDNAAPTCKRCLAAIAKRLA